MKKLCSGILPFYLALGYLIWGIIPHAAFRIHDHAGGDLAHSHLTFHDAGLRNGSFISANPKERLADPAQSHERSEEAASPAPSTRGVAAFKSANLKHGHFTEDENVLGLGARLSDPTTPSPHPALTPDPVRFPLPPYSGPATARGPPSRA